MLPSPDVKCSYHFFCSSSISSKPHKQFSFNKKIHIHHFTLSTNPSLAPTKMPTLIPNAFNLAVIAYVALGSMSCSYGMAVLSSIIGQPSFYTFFHLANRGHHHYSHTSNLLGALNGISCAGSAIGAAMCAWTADKFGRKWTIQVGAAILVVGGALCAGSVDMGMLLVARFIAGLGIGLLITAIPMYQAECSTPESRGFMVSMHGIMFAAGYSLAAWIGFGCYFISAKGSHSSVPWRFPLAFQAFPALLLLLGSFWLPKSPRWLLQQDRADEAFDVLRRLHKTASDPQETRSKREFFQMQKQLEMERARGGMGRWEIFRTKSNRKRALIGFLLMFCNQLTVRTPYPPNQFTTHTYPKPYTNNPIPGRPNNSQLQHPPLLLPRLPNLPPPPPLRHLGNLHLPRQHIRLPLPRPPRPPHVPPNRHSRNPDLPNRRMYNAIPLPPHHQHIRPTRRRLLHLPLYLLLLFLHRRHSIPIRKRNFPYASTCAGDGDLADWLLYGGVDFIGCGSHCVAEDYVEVFYCFHCYDDGAFGGYFVGLS